MLSLENRLILGDCLDGQVGLPSLPAGCVDVAFADCPYNVGYDYDGEYDDNLPPAEYQAWCRRWIDQLHRAVKPGGSFWLLIGDEWVSELDVEAKRAGFHKLSHVIWHFTFGVNQVRKFNRSHVHLLWYVKDLERYKVRPDQVRVPSARALVYNDRRANPVGRMPDDTWILRPQEAPEWFPETCDTWHIPRICGTYKERVAGAANQVPEQLLARCIRVSSNPGDLVLDPFGGTFSTARVAKKLGRRYLSWEQSEFFYNRSRRRVEEAQEGDSLDGAPSDSSSN